MVRMVHVVIALGFGLTSVMCFTPSFRQTVPTTVMKNPLQLRRQYQHQSQYQYHRNHRVCQHASVSPSIVTFNDTLVGPVTVNGNVHDNNNSDGKIINNNNDSSDSSDSSDSNITDNNRIPFWLAVWKFTRPHTLIGSAVAVPALHMLAAPSLAEVFTVRSTMALVEALVPALLMNLYITGLNQLTDVDIDRINKPYLPLPSGLLTQRQGIATVISALLLSLLTLTMSPTWGLQLALCGSFVLGTAYSLPPIRLKRFPVAAAFCIVAVRGTLVNIGFYAHAAVRAFGRDLTSTSSRGCWLSSLFFGIFGIVIALMKDVPDMEGDRLMNIRTFTVRIGQKRIFHAMRCLVTALYGVSGLFFLKGALTALCSNHPFHALGRGLIATTAFLFALSSHKQGKHVDATNQDEVFHYYMYLWKLFYASYLALPFAR